MVFKSIIGIINYIQTQKLRKNKNMERFYFCAFFKLSTPIT